MLFVGIDIASTKHDIAIISGVGEILVSPFTISNSLDGFKKLHTEISSHMEPHDCIHIGLEETGIYSNNIRDFLFVAGFSVYMINPILTHHSRMAHSLRNTKTDKIDCLSICRYIAYNFSALKLYISTVYTTAELKSLSRLRIDKLKVISKSKMEFTGFYILFFLNLLNTLINIHFGLSIFFLTTPLLVKLLICTLKHLLVLLILRAIDLLLLNLLSL